jgi:hypothetical protein
MGPQIANCKKLVRKLPHLRKIRYSNKFGKSASFADFAICGILFAASARLWQEHSRAGKGKAINGRLMRKLLAVFLPVPTLRHISACCRKPNLEHQSYSGPR